MTAYAPGSATSQAAAHSMEDAAPRLRAVVFEEIRLRGGLTCDEVETTLNLSHQTASARIRELAILGELVDSGSVRLTRSDRKAVVWVPAPPRIITVTPPRLRRLHTIEEVEALGGYKVIYADPAWEYTQSGRGSIDDHYDGMPIEEIYALPVSRLAAKDAVLFIWGTWPFLPQVLHTIEAWGFRFKTCAFVWVKHRSPSGKKHVGGGFWTRANTEFCLIGVRGKHHPKRLAEKESRSVRQLIEEWPETPEEILEAPLTKHSAKPKEAHERIVKLLGPQSRIELFARERFPGFDAWGNDPKLGGADVALTKETI